MEPKKVVSALIAVAMTSLALTGCATPVKPDPKIDIDREILQSSTQIMRAQATLYNAGALNNERMHLPVWVDGNQKVTVSWYGDAKELFVALAKAKSKTFSITGVPQSLPVVIDVHDTPYSTIITLLQSQLGYRATLTEDSSNINLQYNKPQP